MTTDQCLAAIYHNLSIYGSLMGAVGLFMGWAITHAWWTTWKDRARANFWRGKRCPVCGVWEKQVEYTDG